MTPSGELPPAPQPLPVPVDDSHCHLDLTDGSIESAVAAAQAVGVRRIVTIGVDVESSEWAADAAAQHRDVFAAVAIHPNDAHRADDSAWNRIEALAGQPGVRAVGETGLDYFRDSAPPAAQQESFRRHIAIAKATGRALVIHDRDAHEDVLRILAEEGAPDRTVFHCFSGDAAMARRCADLGYVLSFAGTLTFANAPALREAAAVTPLDMVLVETDAPFLTPVPYRGRPNASYLVPYTLRALAAAQGRDVAEVGAAVAATAMRIFDFPA
ncbi:MAG TPA: TatD family hydrolase [Mycobacteriales bacterium]|nr:TatD family hydrolase [Mycobacteriales bacterium]